MQSRKPRQYLNDPIIIEGIPKVNRAFIYLTAMSLSVKVTVTRWHGITITG